MKKPSLLKRILKWTGIILLFLIIFIIAAPFIFKDKIFAIVKEEANKNLNAKVEIGDFGLTLFSSFPNFTISLDKVSIAGINEFKGDTLLSFKKLTASVNLMSIIKGEQYDIRTIELDNPRILAKVLSNGKANWDIAKASADTTKAAPPAEPSKFKMKLKKLEIKDGNIVYDDRQGDMKSVLAGFNFNLAGDFTQDNFILEILSTIKEFSFVYGGIPYMNKVNTSIKINMDADMPKFKFTFKDNEFKLNELVLGLDGYFAMPKEDMDMDMKMSARKTEFKNILSLIPGVYTKDFAAVKTSGKLSLDAFVKGIYNDKKMPAFGTRLLIENAMFSYPSMPKSVNNIGVDVKVDNKTGDPDNTIIDVNKFHVEMAGNPLDMKMHISTPVSDANLDGEIKGRFDLASVRDIVPMDKEDNLNGIITADIKMKGRMSAIEKEKYEEFDASGTLAINNMLYKSKTDAYETTINQMLMNFTPKYVELVKFDSKIGKSDIQADGKIEGFLQYMFKDSLLKGTFNMKSAVMDLNEFMAEDEASADATAAAAVPDTSAMSVVAVPGNVDFVLTSSIGKLLYDTYDMTDVAGKVVIREKRISMDQLKMNMMDGTMMMSGYYDTKDEARPKIDFNLNIANWDVGKTTKAFNTVATLAPISKYASGKFSTQLTIASDLDKKMEPVMSTLNGEGKMQTKNIMVSGFEPINKVADALKMDKYKKMAFNNVNISFKFRDGKVYVDPFDMKLGNSLLTTSGYNSFDQSIDYKMKFDIPRSEFGGAANSALNSLVSQANSKGANVSVGDRVKIDVNVLGTVMKPIIKSGLAGSSGSAKEQVKELVKEKIGEVKEDVKAKARAEAEKLMKDAEGLAQNIRNEAAKLADETKKQGYSAADKLEAEAKNPIQKIAAKKGAEKLRKEADQKANGINSEADKKANSIIEEARKKADEKLK